MTTDTLSKKKTTKPKTEKTKAAPKAKVTPKAKAAPVASKSSATEQPKTRRKATTPRHAIQDNLTHEQRMKMIAEAAYYLAEKRGFIGGNPEQDWLEAESRIEEQLKKVS